MLPKADAGNVLIFSGRFGSGKTEIALNYATWLAAKEDEGMGCPILVDLDVVTPYFRTREMESVMNARGVEVVAPLELARSVDVPGLTPQILGAIEQSARPVVVDVGGDPQGARALGRYSEVLRRRGYVLHFVVNPYRPYTSTPAGIRDSVREIESTSRLRVSCVVSNPNLINETTPDLVRLGHEIVDEAARSLDLPICFIAVFSDVLNECRSEDLAINLPVMPLARYFVLPWE
jgi:hypothetical protein